MLTVWLPSYVLYSIVTGIHTAVRRRIMSRKHGCKPAYELDDLPFRSPIANRYWGIDLILGLNIGNVQEALDGLREQTFYPGRLAMWESVPLTKTVVTTQLNLRWLITQDVENVKSVMSTDFDNWAFTPGRKLGRRNFLGDGIFTTDGEAWHRSRNLLKPNFTRFQVSNMALFERHLQKMLCEISKGRRNGRSCAVVLQHDNGFSDRVSLRNLVRFPGHGHLRLY